MRSMHSDCPSNELLAAFIDARLDPRTRARVAGHIASCEECYAFVADVSAAVEAIGAADFEPEGFGTPQPERGRLLPFQAGAAAAAIAAGLAAVFFVPALHESVPGLRSPGAAALAKVAGAKRPSDARLSEISEWREPVGTNRGEGDASDPNASDSSYDLTGMRAEIADAVKAHPTARNLRNLGIAALLEKEPDPAIAAFQRAESLARPDAALLNDLAAAYVARALHSGAKGDAQQALAYADRSWQLERTPAALWNRALALKVLERYAEARATWTQYLAIEKDPQWRDEAKEKLQEVVELAGMR